MLLVEGVHALHDLAQEKLHEVGQTRVPAIGEFTGKSVGHDLPAMGPRFPWGIAEGAGSARAGRWRADSQSRACREISRKTIRSRDSVRGNPACTSPELLAAPIWG